MKLVAASAISILVILFLYLALALVPTVAVGAPIYWNPIYFLLFWIAVVAAVVVIVIGIPVFLLMSRFEKATRINLAIAGFLISLILFFLVSILFGPSSGYSAGQNYHGTYRVLIVKGDRTFWGWLSLIEQGITLCICGSIAAVIFGFTLERLNFKAYKA